MEAAAAALIKNSCSRSSAAQDQSKNQSQSESRWSLYINDDADDDDEDNGGTSASNNQSRNSCYSCSDSMLSDASSGPHFQSQKSQKQKHFGSQNDKKFVMPRRIIPCSSQAASSCSSRRSNGSGNGNRNNKNKPSSSSSNDIVDTASSPLLPPCAHHFF